VDRIVASPMCRCLETGRLMAVGSVETSWDLLPDTGSSTSRLEALERMVSSWRGPGTLVLVTHGFTVQRLAGLMLDQAETLVLLPTAAKRSRSVGRIAPAR
jgi:phosphohistidine phosphatase SixA